MCAISSSFYRLIVWCLLISIIFGQLVKYERGIKRWEDVKDIIKQKGKVVSRLLTLKMSRLISGDNITKPCLESMRQFVKGLERLEKWSLNMFDSSAKLQPGLFRGVLLELGSFDQCLDLSVRNPVTSKETFRGQYCLLQFRPQYLIGSINGTSVNLTGSSKIRQTDQTKSINLTLLKRMIADDFSYWVGTCFPSVCMTEDVHYMTQAVTQNLGLVAKVMECQVSSNKLNLTINQIFAIALLGLIGVLAVIGTILDVSTINSKDKSNRNQAVLTKLVKSFSIYTNTKILFKNGQEKQQLGCFHGMRFITTCWIILGHSYFLPETWYMMKLKNLYGLRGFKNNLALAAIENFSLSVDTFFFMSGVLMTYTKWKVLETNDGKLNVIELLFRKYWRLTPSVAVAMSIPFIIPLMGSGPLWNIGMKQGLEACQNRWWTNLLHIQNFWNFSEICLPHSWHVAALMQCHILGLPLLIITFRWRTLGLTFGFVVIIISVAATAFLTQFYNLPLLNVLVSDSVKTENPYLNIIYIKVYSHLSIYYVGMFVGYLLWKHPKPDIKKIYQIFGWIVAFLCNVAVIYTYRHYTTRTLVILYSSAHRIFWSMGLAWTTFACATGHAEFINEFLSWKPFAVFGQLSYWAYLVHFFFLLAKSAYIRNNFYFTHYNMLYTVLGHIVLSFISAFIFHITIEMPFFHWERMLFQKKEKKKSSEVSSL